MSGLKNLDYFTPGSVSPASLGPVPVAAPPERLTAHTARQLQAALRFTDGQFGRARAAGLIPDPDLRTPRWWGMLIAELLSRRAGILADLPDLVNRDQLSDRLGVSPGEWHRAEEAGLIPAPGCGGYWTARAAADMAARAGQIRSEVPPPCDAGTGPARPARTAAPCVRRYHDQQQVNNDGHGGAAGPVWYRPRHEPGSSRPERS